MRIAFPKVLLPAAVLAATAVIGGAQIERLNLQQMVSRVDNAVEGTIIARQVFRIDHPVDGPELYYTRLTIQGRSTFTGSPLTVDLIHGGGFITEEEGVWNSEAPTEQETRVGKKVLAFYKWQDNLGGDVSGNGLYAAHGGLYRLIQGPNGTIVQGRGPGYAIESNVRMTGLEKQMADALKKSKNQ